jgi:hypothetical protein
VVEKDRDKVVGGRDVASQGFCRCGFRPVWADHGKCREVCAGNHPDTLILKNWQFGLQRPTTQGDGSLLVRTREMVEKTSWYVRKDKKKHVASRNTCRVPPGKQHRDPETSL